MVTGVIRLTSKGLSLYHTLEARGPSTDLEPLGSGARVRQGARWRSSVYGAFAFRDHVLSCLTGLG